MMTHPIPLGYQSHNHAIAVNGIPRDVYFGWLEAGKDPITEAEKAFTLNPPTDPANPATAYPNWDASWPCIYRGQLFSTYHAMCDYLEKSGAIRKWSPKPFDAERSPYDLPERDVLQWLAATGRLKGDDADLWIARVVAPLRHDSVHFSNLRATRRQGVPTDTCAKCGVDLTAKPTHALIRPKAHTDRPFVTACKRKDFDPTKYEAWCRSCVATERWAKSKKTP